MRSIIFTLIVSVAFVALPGCGRDTAEEQDEPPNISLVLPSEGAEYVDEDIIVRGIASDDGEIANGMVYLEGDISSSSSELSFVPLESKDNLYGFEYTEPLQRHCHILGELFHITVDVYDTTNQKTSITVEAEYKHRCAPCEVLFEFDDNVTEDEITVSCEEIGAYIHKFIDSPYYNNSYIIGFPLGVDANIIIEHFTSKGNVIDHRFLCIGDFF